MMVVDGLQYCKWSERIFRDMNAGGVAAVHATIAYHEDFREAAENLVAWNRRFARYEDHIFRGETADDVRRAAREGRTAIFLGFQTPSPIEDDIGLVEVWRQLGVRFMQLSYNNQSMLATGYCESEDAGITRMGREVIAEMNRLGMVVDMSHSGERSTLEAIELSGRPIAVTHANPSTWCPGARNKSEAVMRALAESGGILGFSLYPHHLRGGSDCSLRSFAEMAARAAEVMGADRIGFGSDLCQDQPDRIVSWMRKGTWTLGTDEEQGGVPAVFPPMPSWFRSSRDFPNLIGALRSVGFSDAEVAGIAGGNWLEFFDRSFHRW